MKQLIKIKNSDLSFRLNLNYNNVYSRLKMLLGSKASLFADITTKSTGTTWYSADDAEYISLSQAPKGEANDLSNALSNEVAAVRKEMMADSELSKYVDDILEIPDNSFVFYRVLPTGEYKFVLTGWGCRFIHQNATDPNSGFIRRISHELEFPEDKNTTISSKPSISEILKGVEPATVSGITEKPKSGTTGKSVTSNTVNTSTSSPSSGTQTTSASMQSAGDVKEQPKQEIKKQKVIVKVLDQNNNGVRGEHVVVRSSLGDMNLSTTDEGVANIGELPYGESFSVEFPNLQGHVERSFEVIPGVDIYDAYIKKLIKYSPVLFVEDQNGNAVQDYNVKVVVNGQDSIFNSGVDGVVQLPKMQEGQKFIVIDTANYANTEEYNITQAEAKSPYHFHIKRAEKAKVGITVLDKSGNPIPKATVDLAIGSIPCQQITAEDGRAEFPYDVFTNGEIPVNLSVKGKGQIKSKLNYTSDITEYTIQLQDKKTGGSNKGFNWRWIAIIPLLLLLGYGGYKLYQTYPWGTPTIKEMETGVVLVQSRCSYYVETGLTMNNGKPQCFYFAYDENERKFSNGTFDESERPIQVGTGTGFLISKDGLIATNRHVADPIPPEEASKLVKQLILSEKENYETINDSLNDVLRTIGPLRMMNEQYQAMYEQTFKQLQMIQNYIHICDKILTLGDFKVKVDCITSVAFVNSIIETWEDFIGCSLRASGNPGGVRENDVAIIQLKNKDRDVPKEAFIFNVPEKDIMDGDIPDDYDITVLGYNKGLQLADIKNGIHPQPQPGKVTIKNEEYRIGYNASTLGGSSGSPVLNKEGQLVAVNNSGLADTQGFNYGIRTKYLRELVEKVQGNKNNNK